VDTARQILHTHHENANPGAKKFLSDGDAEEHASGKYLKYLEELAGKFGCKQ
jgi:hypothetical protein